MKHPIRVLIVLVVAAVVLWGLPLLLGLDGSASVALSTAVLVAVTAYYAYTTAQATQTAVRQSSPHVVARPNTSSGRPVVDFINAGGGVALEVDVTVEFTSPDSTFDKYARTQTLDIYAVLPGEKFKFVSGVPGPTVREALASKTFAANQFVAQITGTYSDSVGTRYPLTGTIDFGDYLSRRRKNAVRLPRIPTM